VKTALTCLVQSVFPAALACVLAVAVTACGRDTPNAKAGVPATAAPVPPNVVPVPSETSPGAKSEPKPDPDAELAAKVKAAFGEDQDLKMLPVDIRALHGVVTLYGTADSPRLRDKAVRTASKVEGVKTVINNVQIVRGS
jgi:hyperosmotically inducible protein